MRGPDLAFQAAAVVAALGGLLIAWFIFRSGRDWKRMEQSREERRAKRRARGEPPILPPPKDGAPASGSSMTGLRKKLTREPQIACGTGPYGTTRRFRHRWWRPGRS